MRREELQAFLERPDVLRAILDGYKGAYAVGISLDLSGAPRIRFRREGEAKETRVIMIDNRSVTVVVEGGYRKPRPASKTTFSTLKRAVEALTE